MKKRDINLEFIRILSCLFVVLIHVSNHYRRHMGDISYSSYVNSVVINVVTRLSVPFFFMISGALLLGREPDRNFKRTLGAMKLLAVWSVVYGLWEILKGTKLDLLNILYEPVTKHFWYMYVMIGIYIALPYLQILYKNLSESLKKQFLVIWFSMLAFSFISKFLGYTPKYDIPVVATSTYYFGYFVLGHYIYVNKEKFDRKKSLFIGLLALFVLFVWTMNAGKTVERVLQYRNFLMIIASGTLFHYLLGIKKVPLKETWIQEISICSLGIYYIHIIFLDILKWINYLPIHSIIGIPLITAIVFGLSYLSIKLLHQFGVRT